MDRGVRLFTNILDNMFKLNNINNLSIKMNSEKPSHLRFADYLVLITDKFKEAK